MTKCKENIRFTVVQEKKLCQYLVYLKDQNYPLHYGEVRTAAYVRTLTFYQENRSRNVVASIDF